MHTHTHAKFKENLETRIPEFSTNFPNFQILQHKTDARTPAQWVSGAGLVIKPDNNWRGLSVRLSVRLSVCQTRGL